MHKKLMAAAVAGALMAPVTAFAASANVDFYGYFNAEYGFVSQMNAASGASRESADAFNSGASRMGFRTKESLGGGLTAWAQCETQMNGVWSTGTGQSGLCNRNTAVGLSGGFGNIYLGRWDSAMKKANGTTRMLAEAGWLGAANLMVQGIASNGVEFDFSLRNTHSINYDSPNWGGFQLFVQTTTTNAALNSTSTNVSGRLSSVAGVFKSGPFAVTAGYEEHSDNRSDSGLDSAKDTNMQVGGTYKFGMFKVGLTYNAMEADSGAGVTTEKDSYNLALDIDLAGPGKIVLGYTQANDFECTPACGTDNGAKQYQIGYEHSFSKRTTGALRYGAVDNDQNGTYNFTNLNQGTANVLPGEKGSVFVVQLIHTF